MTALERAIHDPQPVAGLSARSPLHGLDRRSATFWDVLGQSVSATAPSAAASMVPLMVAAVSGAAQIWSILLATVVALLVGRSVGDFARRVAASGSLYTFTALGLGARAGLASALSLVLGYAFIAMCALCGVGLYGAVVIGRVLPGAADEPLVAAGAIGFGAIVLGLVLVLGIRVSTRIALVVEIASVAVILVLVVALFNVIGPVADWSLLSPQGLSPAVLAVGVALGMTAFVGFESSAALGVEARRPFRSIPRAISWTVIVSGSLYLLVTSGFVLGFDAIGRDFGATAYPVDDLATALGAGWVGLLVDLSIAASFLACAIASTTALTRVLFAMSRDGLLPAALGRTHPRRRTPVAAVAVAVPVVGLVPIGLLLAGLDAWTLQQNLIVVSAAGYITAYVLVCAAVPRFLHRIGELTAWTAARSIGAAAVLAAILAVYLVEELLGPRGAGVVAFLVLAVVGALAAAAAHRRRPSSARGLGAHDEAVADDVLGGSAGPEASAG